MASIPLVHEPRPGQSRHPDAADALYRSERRLHGILDTATEAFIALDAEGLVLDWNAAAARLFGWEYLDALGRPVTGLFHLSPTQKADHATPAELMGHVCAATQEATKRCLRMTAVHRTGRRIPVEVAVSRQLAGASHVWHAFLRDLTEQETAERERQHAEERLAYQALHDDLTGLANRTLLLDRLEHALELARRRRSTVAVVLVDLDHFRLVNETLGPWAGDAVLVEVAERLRRAVRASETRARRGQETIARTSGDEFVLVCEDITSEGDAAAIAHELADSLRSPVRVGDQPVQCAASIGIALASAGATPQSLLRDADAAAHRARERGGARYEVFDDAMRARLLDRKRRVSDLRTAIEEDQLRLVYQPIVSAVSGEVVAAEALVRWQHPERGLLGPHEFLPLAEEVGLIGALGQWVLEEAGAQSIRWRTLRPDGPGLRVTVNVSGHQLSRANAAALVDCVASNVRIDPSLLTLEITETVLLEDCDRATEALASLRALGVEILLDDFGTGYSSLSYLHRLPLDGIKLDRTFIAALNDAPVHREVTRSIIQMAKALDLTVVAEGVETAAQLRCLRSLGCPRLQGYLFARPLPVDEMTALMQRSRGVISPAVDPL